MKKIKTKEKYIIVREIKTERKIDNERDKDRKKDRQ